MKGPLPRRKPGRRPASLRASEFRGEDPERFHVGDEARSVAHGSPRGGGMGGVNVKAEGSQLKDAVIGQYHLARQRK